MTSIIIGVEESAGTLRFQGSAQMDLIRPSTDGAGKPAARFFEFAPLTVSSAMLFRA